MSDVKKFFFRGDEVRIVPSENGEPLFVAKDVANALGYAESSNPSRLFQLVPEEWAGVKRIHIRSESGVVQEREVLVISEQGLYFFLCRSDKPKARPFQKWLAGIVLPSIRRTGSYSLPKTSLPPAAKVEASIFSRLALPEDVLKLNRALRVRLLGIAARITLMDPDQREEAFTLFGKLCSITTAEKEKEYEGSPATLFARERLVRSNGKMQARVLYEAFVDWCYSRDLMPCSMRRFCTIMRSRFSVHESNRVYFYCALVVDAQSQEGSA